MSSKSEPFEDKKGDDDINDQFKKNKIFVRDK